MAAESCPACGARADGSRWATSSDGLSRHRLLRCSFCGSEVLDDELPDAIDDPDLYERGVYRAPGGRVDRMLEPWRRLVDRDRLRLLGRLPSSARVIEVGAGRGRLLTALSSRGHGASGIEPSGASAAAAQARGLEVQRLPVEAAEFPADSAELVVFWHVLEHLGDPGAALRLAGSWLTRGGRVVVAVPNRNSLQAKLGGDRWFHQDVPRHRIQFTEVGLLELLRANGYVPGRARHLMVDQNPLGMWLTLINRLTKERDVPFRLLKRALQYERRSDAIRDALIVAIVSLPLLPVALVLEALAGIARRGGTIVVHASPA